MELINESRYVRKKSANLVSTQAVNPSHWRTPKKGEKLIKSLLLKVVAAKAKK